MDNRNVKGHSFRVSDDTAEEQNGYLPQTLPGRGIISH